MPSLDYLNESIDFLIAASIQDGFFSWAIYDVKKNKVTSDKSIKLEEESIT